MSEGWPGKAQERHTRFDMKGKRESLKTGFQGALGQLADAPFSFESGIQEDQQTTVLGTQQQWNCGQRRKGTATGLGPESWKQAFDPSPVKGGERVCSAFWAQILLTD